MDIVHASAVFAALVGLVLAAMMVIQARREHRERERAAASLGEQRELFRTTLASLLESVITTDAAGRITYMNAAAEAMTGRQAGDCAGKPIGEVVRVVDERLRQHVENSAQKALREGEAIPMAHRFFLAARQGHPEVPIDDSATVIRDASGSITGAVLVFRDISQRKRSQDALLEADRRKDEFLAVLAHELRNPLAPLRNALQIARAAANDPDAAKPLWDTMERQVQQMVRLIDDLLDVSRITRNKLQLRKEPVEVRSIVDAALEMSAPLLERFRHTVEVTVPAERLVVEGDRARLIQVLDNLLSNAGKYTDAGGHVAIVVEADGETVRIRVKDNGAGIPAPMLERVFDMFVQVDRSLERSRGGLGIGLTLVRRLVELHGGSVQAKSGGAGAGSEFVIHLPLARDVAARLEPSPAPPAAAATSHRMLVVDDNADAAETLTQWLQIMGHDVRTAYDGLECLKIAENFKPEIVFLDIGMPRLNGYDTAKRLRGEPWSRGMLLVAVTGWGQDEDKRRAREAGFDHHIVKPIDFAALGTLLAAFPGRRHTAPQAIHGRP